MGSASFRNCARTQIENSCPTLSSGDILRKVLSTHLWPALSTWIGPGCRKRSLLLSLAKESAAANRRVINSRCRSMQTTITKTEANVLKQLVERRAPRPSKPSTARQSPAAAATLDSLYAAEELRFRIRVSLFVSGYRFSDTESSSKSEAPFRGWTPPSNFPFHGRNTFRLDIWIIAKPPQPMHIRFSPEPCDLALGIVAMRLLRRCQRRLAIQFAAQELHRLLVSQRRERARFRAIFCEQLFSLGDQSLVKHVRGPLIDAGIKNFSLRIESGTQNAKAVQRFAPFLPKFGHSPARGLARSLARGQTHFDRPDYLRNVVGVNAVRCRRIEPPQDAMKVLGPVLFRASTQ